MGKVSSVFGEFKKLEFENSNGSGEVLNSCMYLCIYEEVEESSLSVRIYMYTERMRRKLVNDQLALYPIHRNHFERNK